MKDKIDIKIHSIKDWFKIRKENKARAKLENELQEIEIEINKLERNIDYNKKLLFSTEYGEFNYNAHNADIVSDNMITSNHENNARIYELSQRAFKIQEELSHIGRTYDKRWGLWV